MVKRCNATTDTILLSPFLILLLFLSLLYPGKLSHYPDFVDWRTLAALGGLLVITTSIKESGYFRVFAVKILDRAGNERKLATYLVLLSCILSSFLTNDVALFIIVPITLSLREIMKRDVGKLIIFEAMAVNAGSLLTPIGNPQNLFLWHQWDVSFLDFIVEMAPLFFLLLATLFLFLIAIFPPRKIDFHTEMGKCNNRMFIASLFLLATYVFSLRMGWEYYAFPIVLILYLMFSRKILLKVDWFLLLLFLIIFIDFRLMAEVRVLQRMVDGLNMGNPPSVFLFSAFLSQIMSNVPATIFLSGFSRQWRAIAYGVNVGGNGFVIASLANIIALRFARETKIWLHFHKFSLPYFFITLLASYLLFFH